MNDLSQPTSPPSTLRPDFVPDGGQQHPPTNGSYTGLSSFYAYDNITNNPDDRKVSCGQGAIASLFDYYNVSPYPLKRISGQPGVDGKPHYDNMLVNHVFQQYPPSSVFGQRFTVRETIMRALNDRGINTNEVYPGPFADGEEEKAELQRWIGKYKLPVLTLIDLFDLAENFSGMGKYGDWYALHWAIVFGFTNTHVHIASWTRIFVVPWDDFMKGWHCKGLPYPNNYYAIYNYR